MAEASAGAGPARPEAAEVDSLGWRIEVAALQLLLVGALAAAAASGWARVEEGGGTAVAVAIGASAPLALALGARALRGRPWPAWAALLGHLGLLGALAVVMSGGLGDAADTLVGGWARLLSSILPAARGSEVEVLALVVAGTASAVGAELALRTRGAATPAIPAVLALVATRMVTQGVPQSRLTVAAVAVALLAGGLALSRAGAVRSGTGVGVALAGAVVAGLLAPALPWAESRDPFDPRALRDLPALDAGTVNPLARLRAWQAAPQRVLLQARISEPTTLRLAVLDRYDGLRFSADPRFVAAGSVLPEPPATDPGFGGTTRQVSADVTVAALDGPWVPAPDRPTRVSGPAVAVDPSTGVVVVPGGLRRGQRYRIVSAVPSERLARFAGAAPAGPEEVGAAASLPPRLPPQVAELATSTAGSPSDAPVARLRRLQELFRTGFSEDPASPPGHSLSRLSAFLDPDDRVGSTEQLATAFALLARSLGYPTRVAVGFRPSGRGDVIVRGGDATAWPEVALAGAGWVAFDPTPPRGTNPVDTKPPEAESVPAAPLITTPTTSPPPPPPPPTPVRRSSPGRSGVALAGAIAGAVVLVAALLLGAIVGTKRWRRRTRRSSPDPGVRVRGAWAEAADRLVERGEGRPPSRTPRQAVQIVSVVPGAAGPLADLGDLAERAAFAGDAAVGGHDADRAWADLDLVEAALAAQDGGLRSLRRAVDPRPLASRRS